MGKKDMDLVMRILARGDQALKVLNRVRERTMSVVNAAKRIGTASAAGFRVMRRAAGAVLAPLKMLSGLLLGLTLAFGAFSGKSLDAAGNIEALQMRLEAVSSSARQASRVMSETMRMSIASPFTPSELVETRIGLMNIGQTGAKALRQVGDAAAITQHPLQDLVSVVAALEAEPLRRIGIEAKRESGRFEFTFRDRMQRVRKIVASGIDDARKSLLSIFEIKYGGGMAKFAKAWKGLTSTLRGLFELAFADFGKGLMPAAKQFVDYLNAKLTTLIESGRLQQLGAKVGDKLMDAFEYGQAVFQYGRNVIDHLVKSGDTQIGKALAIAASTAAQVMAEGLVAYLQGMATVFKGIGHLIGAGLMEHIYDIPGIGPFLKVRDIKRHGGELPDRFGPAVKHFTESMPAISERLMQRIANILQAGDQKVRNQIGFTGKSVPQLLQDIRNRRQQPPFAGEPVPVVPPVPVDRLQDHFGWIQGALGSIPPRTDPHAEFRARHRIGGLAGAGGVRRMGGGIMGLQGGGNDVHRIGGSINIGNLTVRADGVRRIQNDIIRRSGLPALSAAGL